MQKCNCIIDFRMRRVEKDYLISQGYNLVYNNYNLNLYDEIASHVDVSYVKLKDKLVISPDKFSGDILKIHSKCEYIKGGTFLENTYPKDIAYNVCIIGKYAIHNFDYTDWVLKDELVNQGYTLINVKQGYSKCSIVVIDDNSCITSDIGIATTLMDYDIDVLFVSEPDIKLLKRTNEKETNQERMFFEESVMNGFIGGAMACIENEVILFGDIERLMNKNKIREFIEQKGKKIKDFKGIDVIDYGGLVII